MKEYLDVLRDIVDNGWDHEDRTGSGRRSLTGLMLKFDVSDGTVPLITTRQQYPKSIIGETLWFLKGSSCTKELRELGVKFWDRWAVTEADIDAFIAKYIPDDVERDTAFIKAMSDDIGHQHLGNIGPIYGPNWRNAPADLGNPLRRSSEFNDIPSDKLKTYRKEYIEQNTIGDQCDIDEAEFVDYAVSRYDQTVDQLNELVLNLKRRPYSSRHIVSAWVPQYIPYEDLSPQENVLLGKGALAPCHMTFQCFVKPGKTEQDRKQLSLLVYFRSNDVPVGMPVNIAQYSIILHLLAHVTDMDPGTLIYTAGDYHCYLDQLDVAKIQLSRNPYPLPGIWVNPEVKDLYALTSDDIEIIGYQPHGVLTYPVSV